jgi:hypothetical protein
VLLLAACVAAPDAGQGGGPEYRYRLRFEAEDGGGASIHVAIGVPPGAPLGWRVEPPPAPLEVEVTTTRGTARARTEDDGSLDLPEGTTRLEYAYPLGPASSDLRTGVLGRISQEGRARPAALVAGEGYLLRPRLPEKAARVVLEADGTEQLPWPAAAEGPRRLPARALVDPGFHAFGARRLTTTLPDGAELEVALVGELAASDDVLTGWLAQAGREVLTVRPTFPTRRLLVGLAPVGGVDEASPFGMTLWSEPPSLGLYVGAEATAKAFAGDWVAVHEMMHLVHPHVVPAQDEPTVWVTEGLATYLSILGRLRSGRVDGPTAWGELTDGVVGGRGSVRGRTLEELCRVMHREHCYLAVYWGGALLFLDLDVAIRAASAGEGALEDAVARLRDEGRSVTVAQLLAEADRVAGAPVARAVADRHLKGPALGTSEALLARLGIRPAARWRAALDDQAPEAKVRQALGMTR